jgi:hypothetical protein
MITSKKLKTFINVNFMPPMKYDIETQTSDLAVVLLDYGKGEPKMRITVQNTSDANNLLKLIDTKIIESY